MKFPVVLLNFTGVYNYEPFAQRHGIIHVDCRDMKGVDCYCDEEGLGEIRRRLIPVISIISRNIGCQGFGNLSRSSFLTTILTCSSLSGLEWCHAEGG